KDRETIQEAEGEPIRLKKRLLDVAMVDARRKDTRHLDDTKALRLEHVPGGVLDISVALDQVSDTPPELTATRLVRLLEEEGVHELLLLVEAVHGERASPEIEELEVDMVGPLGHEDDGSIVRRVVSAEQQMDDPRLGGLQRRAGGLCED